MYYKTAVSDGIPAEIYKCGGGPIKINFFSWCWTEEQLANEGKDVTIITIFQKSDRSFCDEHCDISFFDITGKFLTTIHWILFFLLLREYWL